MDMSDTVLVDKQISSSICSCVINVPFEKVDLTTWLFKLSEPEYRRCCPPDHVSCGTTSTDEGKPMVINVEMIGHALMIQRYVAEIATSTLCKLVSISEAFTPNGRTRVLGFLGVLTNLLIDVRLPFGPISHIAKQHQKNFFRGFYWHCFSPVVGNRLGVFT